MRIEILARVKFEFDLEEISIWKRVKYVHLGNEKEIQSGMWNIKIESKMWNILFRMINESNFFSK